MPTGKEDLCTLYVKRIVTVRDAAVPPPALDTTSLMAKDYVTVRLDAGSRGKDVNSDYQEFLN